MSKGNEIEYRDVEMSDIKKFEIKNSDGVMETRYSALVNDEYRIIYNSDGWVTGRMTLDEWAEFQSKQ